MNENVVHDYGWTSVDAPYSFGYIGPEIISTLKRLGSKRVLDVGAGNGALCAEIHNHGFDIVGMEYDRQGCELARRNIPGIRFYNFGVQHDPAEILKNEDTFDTVVSTEVIEHLFAPHLLPIFARGVLRKGGRLIITTPYHGYLKNFAISALNKWDKHHTTLWHGGHIKFWSRPTITTLLETHGFKVEHFTGVGRLPYLWKSMIVVAHAI